MSRETFVKICGLTRSEDVAAAAEAGATYVGFVFFEKSPRHLSPAVARDLAIDVPPGIAKVALVVDADDSALDALTRTVPLDMLQLHGRETLDRVAAIRARYGLPVMKAIGIADADDLDQIERYGAVADQLLIDAKPPIGADRPGGNAAAFDWSLIAGREWPVPWLLAGGLTPDNVSEAVQITGARQVDVSTGVERSPGIKDAGRIRSFITAARA